MKRSASLCTAMFFAASASAAEPGLAEDTYSRWVGPQGEIKRPVDVRKDWTHLGSWVVADENAAGHGFHDVYTQPEAARQYLQTGRFPDGAVLMKEIRKLRRGDLTTGPAMWAGEPAVWFVMVKDGQGRFKNNPHWAEGWGWALFEAKAADQNVSKGFGGTCQACHTPAKGSDWVFIDGYPTLKP